jgi:hypothetical protein
MLQLACRVLVEAADPGVADALTVQGILLRKSVRKKFMILGDTCPSNLKPTLF